MQQSSSFARVGGIGWRRLTAVVGVCAVAGLSLSWVTSEAGGVPANAGPCPADTDGSGAVDITDLTNVLICFGDFGPDAGVDCPGPGDLTNTNGDMIVNEVDQAYVIESIGVMPCPTPGGQELFDQVCLVEVDDPDAAAAGLVVTHLYATGSALTGTESLLLAGFASISAAGSTTFFQEPNFGADVPPNSGFFGVFPELEYDTFVTMDKLSDFNPTLAPGFTMTTTNITGSWFASPGPERVVVDISAATGVPGQLGVRIAQITMDANSNGGSPAYDGLVRLYTSTYDGGSLSGFEASIVDCNAGGCPTTGACCCNGVCIVATQADCLAAGGTYEGDDTPCANVTCGGACCIAGSCAMLSEADCNGIPGGRYQGNGTSCGDVVCEYCSGDADFSGPVNIDDIVTVILGYFCQGCQLTDGSCTLVKPQDCLDLGGTPAGDFVGCDGACTGTPSGCVEVATEAACNDQGGVWGGHGTTCP